MTIPTEIHQSLKGFFLKSWLVIIIVFSCIITGYASVIFLGKDNLVEEEIEKVIEAETGVKFELTP